jgi:hypothetical protein
MGRPRKPYPQRVIDLPVNLALLARLDALLTPKGEDKPPIGARARTINALILRYVQERERQVAQTLDEDSPYETDVEIG